MNKSTDMKIIKDAKLVSSSYVSGVDTGSIKIALAMVGSNGKIVFRTAYTELIEKYDYKIEWAIWMMHGSNLMNKVYKERCYSEGSKQR